MSFIQGITKRLPSAPSLPLEDAPNEKGRLHPRFAFFRRRIRLKGNSSISIPLGLVLLFPCLVIVLILLLFVRHPASPGGILIPAGTPPSIRFVSPCQSVVVRAIANLPRFAEKSVKNMIKSLLRAVCLLSPMKLQRLPAPMPPLSSLLEIRSWMV